MPPDTSLLHLTFPSLLQAVKANNEEAMKQFYHAEYPKTEKYIRENKGTAEQAKDIFQEAFIAMWRNVQLDKIQAETQGKLAAYLYQVAKNKWIDYLRSGHQKNVVPMSGLREFDTADELPEEQHHYLEAVKMTFKQLSENRKEILNRFYYKNETAATIAEAMDWTEATVRNNKYRCMERLRDMLKKK